jgi:glycosyltransferase involved in cell wall biosynthesis
MDKWRCGAVVVARDEGRIIRTCLESLKRQTVDLFLVVVNDGSLDNTGKVASEQADVVVNLPRHEKSWTGRPELAKVTNAGFEVLRKKDISYVLISGADAVYPSNYVEEITSRMRDGKIVLASGFAEGDVSRSLTPRGCGRVIERQWFENVGFRYPENYNFEGYLVYKALSQGRKVTVFRDLRFKLSRKTRLSQRKLYLWGKGMRALNYWWPYAIGRIILIGLRQPRNGYEMLRGYLSKTPQYEDVKHFVPNYQVRTFVSRAKETIRHF